MSSNNDSTKKQDFELALLNKSSLRKQKHVSRKTLVPPVLSIIFRVKLQASQVGKHRTAHFFEVEIETGSRIILRTRKRKRTWY